MWSDMPGLTMLKRLEIANEIRKKQSDKNDIHSLDIDNELKDVIREELSKIKKSVARIERLINN